jgi:hypothetical protein
MAAGGIRREWLPEGKIRVAAGNSSTYDPRHAIFA